MLSRPARSRRPSRTLLFLSALTLTSTALLVPMASASAARSVDRDHDQMADRWERSHGLKVGVDDRFRDLDGDRLVNVVEFRRGTKPRQADSDRDGLRDGREIRYFKTNPRKADTDRDGLSDGREVRRSRTNPRRADTDRDGLSDGREVLRLGSNPNSRDTDGDGVDDATEVSGGTDPTVNDVPGGTTPPTPGTLEQFTGLLEELRSLGLDPAQVEAVEVQIVAALAGDQLSSEDLAALLEPIVEALSDAGLPADQVTEAMLQVLAALSAGELPSDPSGLLNLVIDALQDALAGTPLDQLNPILEQVQDALDDIVGGILGGLPIP